VAVLANNVPRRIFRREKQVLTVVLPNVGVIKSKTGREILKFTIEKAMKAQRGSRYIAELFFNRTLGGGGGGWSAPRSGRFTPGKDPVPIV